MQISELNGGNVNKIFENKKKLYIVLKKCLLYTNNMIYFLCKALDIYEMISGKS